MDQPKRKRKNENENENENENKKMKIKQKKCPLCVLVNTEIGESIELTFDLKKLCFNCFIFMNKNDMIC